MTDRLHWPGYSPAPRDLGYAPLYRLRPAWRSSTTTAIRPPGQAGGGRRPQPGGGQAGRHAAAAGKTPPSPSATPRTADMPALCRRGRGSHRPPLAKPAWPGEGIPLRPARWSSTYPSAGMKPRPMPEVAWAPADWRREVMKRRNPLWRPSPRCPAAWAALPPACSSAMWWEAAHRTLV